LTSITLYQIVYKNNRKEGKFAFNLVGIPCIQGLLYYNNYYYVSIVKPVHRYKKKCDRKCHLKGMDRNCADTEEKNAPILNFEGNF